MALWKIGLLGSVFALLFVAERVSPLRAPKRTIFKRLCVNAAMTAAVFLVGSLLVRTTASRGIGVGASRGVGLCRWLPLPSWARAALSFCLMDLTFYYWHRANHRIALLWRFHNVHHVDPDLDVSTSFRFHPVEIAYAALFRLAQVLVVGVTPLLYVAYETAFACGTMFHHSNVRLPFRFEYWLNMVFVTPRMHGIHHSAVRTETDSNYSVVFSWWDRLHRTVVLNVRQSDIRIGVPMYQQPGDNGLCTLVKMPFIGQRRHCGGPDGMPPGGNQDAAYPSGRMLA